MKYVGAIDQGTTSTRFVLFNQKGDIIAKAQKEHKQIYPQPGWCEHDPMEILEATYDVIKQALAYVDGLTVAQLAAVGITNQRETAVLWDKTTGKPVYNAIVWHDVRTMGIVQKLKSDSCEGIVKSLTGLPVASYFSATKIMWLLDNIEGLREKCSSGNILFGNIDTWLIWNLTGGIHQGVHVTDVTNASRTMLMSLDSQAWDDRLLKITNIPGSILPSIRSSSEVYGMGAADSALPGVVISGDLGDQHAALFGQTCFSAGEAKNTYGTGCFFIMNTGTKRIASTAGLLTTIGYKIGNQPTVFALEGSVAVAGSLVQWLRDNMKIISSAPEVEELAKQVEDNGGVYLVPAFSGLFAPYWRDDARGAIVGLTSFCNRNHIARAALEATAFQTLDVVNAMVKDSGQALIKLKVDGGMVVNETLMQFQSDILKAPVVRPLVTETTSLGAAYAAGLAVGYWKNLNELRANWKTDKEWQPVMDAARRDDMIKHWHMAIEKTLNWA